MEFIEELPEEENIAFSNPDQYLKTTEAKNSRLPIIGSQESGNIRTLDKDEFSPTKRSQHKAMMLEQYNQTGVKLKFIKDICPTPMLRQNYVQNKPVQHTAKPVLPKGALGSFGSKTEIGQASNLCSVRLIKNSTLNSPANRAFLGRSSHLDRSPSESPFGPSYIRNGLFHVELFQSNQYLDGSPVSDSYPGNILVAPKVEESYN